MVDPNVAERCFTAAFYQFHVSRLLPKICTGIINHPPFFSCLPVAMANCESCNSLGSSPKFQLLLSVVVVLLFIVGGVYGIALIDDVMNFSVYDYAGYPLADFFATSSDLAYLFGAVVTELWICWDFLLQPRHANEMC